jgi:pyruvate/2-oxoglutarate dehydrogenase complex dihydrolipoamide dehydrogenase (E3) component
MIGPRRIAAMDYDLLVIGAGTAGTFAARQGMKLRARTALVEQDGFAGTCLGTG